VTVTNSLYLVEDIERRPVAGVGIVAPTPATIDEVTAVHDAAFVEAVRTGEPRRLAASAGIGWDDRLWDSVTASTGGVRDAVLSAWRTGGIAGSLSSGLHHARAHEGSGYCTFNGLVVAARAALADGAGRVTILDLDAHCGGGTAALTAELAGVDQTDVSVQHYDTYASRSDARLTFADGSDYLDVVAAAMAAVPDPGGIGVLLYNAGMDPHEGAGGVAGITADVLARRERMVFDWAAAYDLPVAFVLAGGYTTGIAMDDLVALHRITVEEAAAAEGRRMSDAA
jgi:acetoin utilization deacetylase AcuC-like enzyme